MAIALKKINEYLMGLAKAQTGYIAKLGTVGDASLWASIAPDLRNGNALLVQPGPLSNQVSVVAGSMMVDTGFGPAAFQVSLDYAINGVPTIPIGARTDGTNYFFSSFTSYGETPVLLAGRYNHIYAVYDSGQPGNAAYGVISTTSDTDPSPSLYSYLGVVVPGRQAMVLCDASGNPVALQTFPAMWNPVAFVASDAPAAFATWDKQAAGSDTNAISMTFTFPPGTGTGLIGEAAVFVGTTMLGYAAVSPALLKDSDVEFAVNFNLMLGEPGGFV